MPPTLLKGGRNILWPPTFEVKERRSAREARETGNDRTKKMKRSRSLHKMVRLLAYIKAGAAALGARGAMAPSLFWEGGRNILWPPTFEVEEQRSAREAREKGNDRRKKKTKRSRALHKMVRLRA